MLKMELEKKIMRTLVNRLKILDGLMTWSGDKCKLRVDKWKIIRLWSRNTARNSVLNKRHPMVWIGMRLMELSKLPCNFFFFFKIELCVLSTWILCLVGNLSGILWTTENKHYVISERRKQGDRKKKHCVFKWFYYI